MMKRYPPNELWGVGLVIQKTIGAICKHVFQILIRINSGPKMND
jgi:hypothetical protein